jgi:cytochrome P450
MSLLANSPDETGAHPGDKAVLNHLPTLFAAAYETCQTALTWALFLLAQHPHASAALLEELAALPDDDPERLLECKRLDAVINESLRLLPSVPTQTRRASRDTDLVDCNVRKGAYVVLSAFLTNRDPGTFTEPDRFKPERWDAIDPTQYEYLVFSAGPRTCIGSWFASTYLKVAIGQIVKRFRLRIVPNARIDQNVRLTLRPGKGGVPAIIHPQDGRFEASPIGGNIRRIVRFA